MKRIVIFLMLLSFAAFAADVKFDITAETNRATTIKVFYWADGGAPADSTGMSWSASFLTDHSGEFDTGIAAAVAVNDSGGIRLTWDAATNHDGYRLAFNPNDDGWTVVDFIHPDSTGYTHEITDTVKPRRGEINYRLYSFAADLPDSEWSGVAILPSYFYNQSVKIYTKFHASEGEGETIAESQTASWVYRSSVAADTDPPDTTLFAGVVVDSTYDSGNNLTLSLATFDAGELVQAQFEWSQDSGSTYIPDAGGGDGAWVPVPPHATVWDSIRTTIPKATFFGSSATVDIYTRYRLRDDESTPNVTAWQENQFQYSRESTVTDRHVAIVIDNTEVDGSVDLTDYPVLLTEDNFPSEIFDADGTYPATNGGGDLRFYTDSGLTTEIAREVVSFVTDNDPANGTAEVYVKVPTVTYGTDTTIYCKYNTSDTEPAAGSTYGSQAVWSDYVAVYHLTNLTDSTVNGDDGIATTPQPESTTVLVGGSHRFYSSTADDIDISHISYDNTSIFSSCWIRAATQTGAYPTALGSRTSGQADRVYNSVTVGTGYPTFGWAASGTAGSVSTDIRGDTIWHYMVTQGTTAGLFYFDGGYVGTSAVSMPSGTPDITIGGLYTGDGNYAFIGYIDEVRWGTTQRTTSWITTMYNNMSSPSTFTAAGTPQ